MILIVGKRRMNSKKRSVVQNIETMATKSSDNDFGNRIFR